MVMVCFSVIIAHKPRPARGSRASYYEGQWFTVRLDSKPEWNAVPPRRVTSTPPNKSFNASGDSVFCNINDVAMLE